MGGGGREQGDGRAELRSMSRQQALAQGCESHLGTDWDVSHAGQPGSQPPASLQADQPASRPASLPADQQASHQTASP
eukprot:23525-Chlamydomonas_euryale.AAC.13